MEQVLGVGGLGPFEFIYEFIGGRMPGGPEGSPAEVAWQQMRAWQAIFIFHVLFYFSDFLFGFTFHFRLYARQFRFFIFTFHFHFICIFLIFCFQFNLQAICSRWRNAFLQYNTDH